MTDTAEVEPTTETPPHCKTCGVAVKPIVGTAITPGRTPNWVHDWGAYATLAERPNCPLSGGPLWDDQVEGGSGEEEFENGGRWTEKD